MKSATARQLDIPPTREEMTRAHELFVLLRGVVHDPSSDRDGIDVDRTFEEFAELNGLMTLHLDYLGDAPHPPARSRRKGQAA